MPTLAQEFFRRMPSRVQSRLMGWAPRTGSTTIRLHTGAKVQFDSIGQSQLLQVLYWRGITGFEFSSVMLFLALAQRSRVILDIGSYIGYYAILASRVNPTADILSFEPVPENQRLQRHFLDRNACSNVQLENMALGDKSGEATFFLPEWSNSPLPNIGSLANRFLPGETYADRGAREIRVPVSTIDDVVQAKQLTALDLIKIDVEDMEWPVMLGGQQAISRWHPDIIAEVTPSAPLSQTFAAGMIGLGYSMYEIGRNQLRRIGELGELDYVRSRRGGFSEILFSHRSADTLAEIDAARRDAMQVVSP
jgi:FkbM family methyltransferase